MECRQLNHLYLSLCVLMVYTNLAPKDCAAQGSEQHCNQWKYEGYHCVPKDNCDVDGYEIDEEIFDNEIRDSKNILTSSFNPEFVPADYTCDTDSEICCRKSTFFGKPEPIIRPRDFCEYDCDRYTDYGYKCVEGDSCGSDRYFLDESEIEIPRDSIRTVNDLRLVSSFGSRMSCKSTAEVCCRDATFYGQPEPPGKRIVYWKTYH